MGSVPLSLACWDYDRVRGLIDGTVPVEGVDLHFLTLPVEETFWRMVVHQEFDVSEMSFSSYLIARSRGTPRITGIPVFISRYFRHGCIFVNKDAGIQTPSDLKGKRVGVPEFQMTASVWARGILSDHYAVRASDMIWYQGGQETPGRPEKPGVTLPPEIELHTLDHTQTLNAMLAAGELDALVSARAPQGMEAGSSPIRRLFPNYGVVEREYYRQTGIFPIMHLIVVRDEVLEQHPWVASNLYQAFIRAKAQAISGLSQSAASKATLPWVFEAVEQAKDLMGEDYWPYGVASNRAAIETFVRYSFEQGLISSILPVDSLFASTTLDDFYAASTEAH